MAFKDWNDDQSLRMIPRETFAELYLMQSQLESSAGNFLASAKSIVKAQAFAPEISDIVRQMAEIRSGGIAVPIFESALDEYRDYRFAWAGEYRERIGRTDRVSDQVFYLNRQADWIEPVAELYADCSVRADEAGEIRDLAIAKRMQAISIKGDDAANRIKLAKQLWIRERRDEAVDQVREAIRLVPEKEYYQRLLNSYQAAKRQ
ncbi:MAG: hypothetical protein AAF664_11285 [Planctomycetota bacterium]